MYQHYFTQLKDYEMAFDCAQYHWICLSYCHEGLDIIDLWVHDDEPDSWIELGICSHGVKIMVKDLPDKSIEFVNKPFVEWPTIAQEAAKQVCVHILDQFRAGHEGC